jgi:hypothetical protein
MSRLKAIFAVVLAVVAVYAAWVLLPPYISNYEFQDDLENEALINSYSSKSDLDIRNTLAKKAADYGIPLKVEQIFVQRTGPELAIWADYTVHLDLIGWGPLDLTFHPATKNKRI